MEDDGSKEREISYDGALYSSILNRSYPEDEIGPYQERGCHCSSAPAC